MNFVTQQHVPSVGKLAEPFKRGAVRRGRSLARCEPPFFADTAPFSFNDYSPAMQRVVDQREPLQLLDRPQLRQHHQSPDCPNADPDGDGGRTNKNSSPAPIPRTGPPVCPRPFLPSTNRCHFLPPIAKRHRPSLPSRDLLHSRPRRLDPARLTRHRQWLDERPSRSRQL